MSVNELLAAVQFVVVGNSELVILERAVWEEIAASLADLDAAEEAALSRAMDEAATEPALDREAALAYLEAA